MCMDLCDQALKNMKVSRDTNVSICNCPWPDANDGTCYDGLRFMADPFRLWTDVCRLKNMHVTS